jgi:hypothetical protein
MTPEQRKAEIERLRLLPCPFCGGQGMFCEEGGGEFIECDRCMCSSKMMFPEMDEVKGLLAEAWNTRGGKLAALEAEVQDEAAG